MSLEAHGRTYLSVSRLAALSRACPSPVPGALAACGYFLKSFVSLGPAARLISEDGGCSWMCCRISLAAQLGARRGGGPECICACSEAGLELTPFCWRTGRNLHPGEEKSVSSRDLGACARSLSVLLGHWDLPYPPTHPGSFLGLLVWPCLTAAALQLPRPREVQAGRRARCKLHGGLPSPR